MLHIHAMFGLKKLIRQEDKGLYLQFSLVSMGYISLWAILHDQIIIRIEPRHFTDYHRPLLDLSNHTLLAIQYGFVATFGLGLVFGMLTYFVSQAGQARRMPFKQAFSRLILLSLVIETICLTAGFLQYHHYSTNQEYLFYPASFFPDRTLGIAVTQTMNLSAYLMAGIGSVLYWISIYRWRLRE